MISPPRRRRTSAAARFAYLAAAAVAAASSRTDAAYRRFGGVAHASGAAFAFAPSRRFRGRHHRPFRLGGSGSSNDDGGRIETAAFDDALIDAARARLGWEVLAEMEDRPALDLSSARAADGFLSLSEEAAVDGGSSDANNNEEDESALSRPFEEEWTDGRRWFETLANLRELGVISDRATEEEEGADANANDRAEEEADLLLRSVPQLLRLEPSVVKSSAETVLDLGIPPKFLASQPALLAHTAHQITDGLEFLSTMMMSTPESAIVLAKMKPGLLLGGVEGAIQESAVKRALGEAGGATDGANKRIAGDLGATLRARRDGPTSSLGGGG